MKLYTKITIGLILGVTVGAILHFFDAADLAVYTDYVGKLFIRLVKMVVVPLILASLILGAANLGDIKKLGRLGLKTVIFFMSTTAIAVTIGILLTDAVRPGASVSPETRDAFIKKYEEAAKKQLRVGQKNEVDQVIDVLIEHSPDSQKQSLIELKKNWKEKEQQAAKKKEKSQLQAILDIIIEMAPTNPIGALARGDMLAIIFFSLFFGICITLIPPDRSRTLMGTLDGMNEAILKMVGLAMETAPYGVFALMVGVTATMGLEVLWTLLVYGLVVIAGLFLHLFITYGSIITFYLKTNPIRFLLAVKEAIIMGFSTSSSSATLPISMNVAEKNLGASNEIKSFVLPLGATLNMDGTALYQGAAAIFIAQTFQMDLSFGAQLTMVLTATLASIGAAGVPGAGMITLAVVLSTANIPAEGIALIFGLDRILDMFRTSLNIVGDLTCTAVMAKSQGEDIQIQS